MTAYNGTVLVAPKWDAGREYTAYGYYTLGGALANTDTITWANLIPKGATVLEVEIEAPELDTDNSPTGTFDVGDGTDVDCFIDGWLMSQPTYIDARINVAPASQVGVGYKTTAAKNLVLTVATAVETGATTGTIHARVRYLCTN